MTADDQRRRLFPYLTTGAERPAGAPTRRGRLLVRGLLQSAEVKHIFLGA